MVYITKKQAQAFILSRHGLLGEHIFKDKNGCMDFIQRVQCIQYDPVNVCGRNADIVLHSRIKAYQKDYLNELLYQDRKLIDCFDKNLAITLVEDFSPLYDNKANRQADDRILRIMPQIRQLIKERGHVSSKDMGIGEKILWDWGVETSLARAALEHMYASGELIIHHKIGTNKKYALLKDHIPDKFLNMQMPFTNTAEKLAWRVKRRIKGVGMLWNKASDAFLGLNLKSAERNMAFTQLLKNEEIFEVNVEGLKESLYICKDEKELFETVLSHSKTKSYIRTEFIAPLDSFMWDRKLIYALFGFEYKWEIYTPKEKRKFGAYTLPILHNGEFIGRIDMARKNKILEINNIWLEDDITLNNEIKSAISICTKRFADFNNCTTTNDYCNLPSLNCTSSKTY
ncbi:MAG: winged helix DNA-binding domain-containing protein [Defluviitaleaceae bacterium]|nr:winged helix DNA-binding domain-containing protein [Defluviitaleaceae bacterium]